MITQLSSNSGYTFDAKKLLLIYKQTMDSGNSENSDFKLVKTVNGSVRGLKCTTIYEQKSYHAFRGIPYAKPPINELRFKVSSSDCKLN